MLEPGSDGIATSIAAQCSKSVSTTCYFYFIFLLDMIKFPQGYKDLVWFNLVRDIKIK
jgi:hypothetical protein